jgi:hypothetical protein
MRFGLPLPDFPWPHALDKPARYVLETAYSQCFGDSAGVLGFSNLTLLGVGLELDSSKYPVIITRTRTMVRCLRTQCPRRSVRACNEFLAGADIDPSPSSQSVDTA